MDSTVQLGIVAVLVWRPHLPRKTHNQTQKDPRATYDKRNMTLLLLLLLSYCTVILQNCSFFALHPPPPRLPARTGVLLSCPDVFHRYLRSLCYTLSPVGLLCYQYYSFLLNCTPWCMVSLLPPFALPSFVVPPPRPRPLSASGSAPLDLHANCTVTRRPPTVPYRW